jgi:23S rRNA (adenine2503-C2)-methyltransferase
VRCPFCDAAEVFHGNLTADELLAQVRWVLARHPGQAATCRKLKVHFARMGEPALNDAVLEALERLPEEVASPGLWACLATVAPRGREAWFERLIDVKHRRYRGRFQLQFSVQSTDPAERARLIPVPHWPLARIAAYGTRFFQPGDRRVVLNLALARGVAFDPAEVRRHFDAAVFAVKLTPVNPTARGRANGVATVLRSEDEAAVRRAADVLVTQGYDVVLSVGDEREDRVGSNCGQAVRVTR